MSIPARYKNPWHKPKDRNTGPEFFTTAVRPAKYRGYLIYHTGVGGPGRGVWDVVKDGVCVSQRAGPRGAREVVDEILEAA